MSCTLDRLLDSGLEMKTCAAAAAAVKLIADWISPSSDDRTRSDWALVRPMLLSWSAATAIQTKNNRGMKSRM